MKKDVERRWMRRLVRWGWFACFLGNYEWYRRLYGGLWAHVHVEEPCYSCMWLNCPAGADETYREWNWRGTPEFRNYDSANTPYQSPAPEIVGELIEEIRSLTEQRDRLQKIVDEQCRVSSVCREYREQRDRLAEAMQKLRNNESMSLGGAAYEIVEQALQSLTTKEQ